MAEPPFPPQPVKFHIQTQIEGLEVTQALQYYRAFDHLTDALDRGPDNSLLLVANKPAYVRVYLRYGLAAPTQYVTGELIVTRYHDGNPIKWDTPTTLSPVVSMRAIADPNASYDQRRSILFQSLNFLVPPALMAGKLRIEARIRYFGGSTDEVVDTRQIRVDATTIQFLPVRGVFITYSGPDGTGKPLALAAPTMSQLQGLASDALTMFPVEATTRFSSAGGTTWNLPLNDQVAGMCSTNWNKLLARLAVVRAIDGNRQDLLYYGVLPVGVPMSPVVGCGGGGLAAGDTNGVRVFAHETGHALGLGHAPACADGPDPKYPAYEPYDSAMAPRGLIGEYGFDFRKAATYPPRTTDFMGYCNPYWISLYSHRFLTAHAKLVGGSTETRIRTDRRQKLLDPYRPKWTIVPDPPPPWVDPAWTIKPRPMIVITGTVRSGQIVDPSVVRVVAVPVAQGDATPFSAALIDANGEHLASGRLVSLHLHAGGCGCAQRNDGSDEFAFQAMLNNVAPGTRLAIFRRDDREMKEVWFVEARERRSKLTNVRAMQNKKQIELAWDCDPGGSSIQFSVQFSKDAGESWNATATLIDETRFTVPLERLPEGPVVFRVLAHDGFDTVHADSKRVAIPAVRPSLAVLSPRQNEEVATNQPLLLWAAAIDQNGAPVTDDRCRWQIDGKTIGVGQQLLIAAPSPGKHIARAMVSGRGGRAACEVAFATFSDEVPAN